MRKMISMILAAVIALTAVSVCAEAADLDWEAFAELLAEGPVADREMLEEYEWASSVWKSGQLRVGGTRNNPLFGTMDEEEKNILGFDAGLYQLLARYIYGDESRYQLIQVSPENREYVLEENQADVVVETYSITEERQELVSFAGPYLVSQAAVMIAADNEEIEGLDSLAGKKVAVMDADLLEEYAPEAEPILCENAAGCLQAVRNGSAEACVGDFVQLLKEAVKEPGEFRTVGEFFGPEDSYGIGMQMDTDGVEFVNVFLAEIEDMGLWDELWMMTLGDRAGMEDVPEYPAIDD